MGAEEHLKRSIFAIVFGGLLKRPLERFSRSYEKRRDKYLGSTEPNKCPAPCLNVTVGRRDSVLFVGYAQGALGLGEAFRDMLQALNESGMSFSIYPFIKNIEDRIAGDFMSQFYDITGIYDINVAYFAADQLPLYFEELKAQADSGAYNVLTTYWELPKAPEEWRPLLARIDEIWVPNSFVADAFRPIFDGVITVLPTCVRISRVNTFDRAHFGMQGDAFYFLFSFDFYSRTARKNPVGVVQAFGHAFADRKHNVGLVIKSTGPEHYDPTAVHYLENAARLDNRVKVINRTMGRDEMLSLIAECDCYISLHRSEGFGLGMAEAMALGKSVIGTDFSGNTEFLTHETGFPIPFEIRPLIPGEYPYAEGQVWAEPDLEAAIKQMRYVVDNPLERAKRAQNGHLYIRTHNSAEAVAQMVRARLEEIKQFRRSTSR